LVEQTGNTSANKTGVFKQKMAQLLSIKSIVTLEIVTVFCYLAFIGEVKSEVFITVVTSVLSFYFGTVHEKKS
jgi:hypothetical protein